MQEIIGTSNKILEVDLSTKSFKVFEVPEEDRKLYLGGKGLGLKLFYDRIAPGIDPLGEENALIFMMGVFMGTGAPCAGRFAAISKSPLTGIMGTASSGGPFGMALKTSGWDGIIITGKAKTPTYLAIDSKGVQFKAAKAIWGKDTQESQKFLDKEGTGALTIGPAGENLVRYANICSGHRFLGRCGMGAVMGSKNLKGVVAKGKEFKIVPVNQKKFEKARKKTLAYINRNAITSGSYRNFGTNANVNLCNAGGLLPVRNYTGGSHGEAHKISGEEMAERFNTKFSTCKPCSILCGHKGNFEDGMKQIPEYETIGLFGSNLEIFDPVVISDWNELCTKYGIDTISAGNTIAWAMEATEKGLIQSDLKFGSTKGVDKILKDITYQKGLGKDLALGTRECSKKYGGEDFAMHVKGLELAAYDPRGAWGQALSYAVANRGACHLSTASFAVEVFLNMHKPYTTRGKGEMTKFLEDVTCAVNSMHICQFTAFAVELEPFVVKYTPTPLLNIMVTNINPIATKFMDVSLWPEMWSGITGKRLGMFTWIKAGTRTHVLERYMNTLEGISRKDDTLPNRFLSEGRNCDPKNRTVPLDTLLDKYYSARGFDKNGIPTDRLLKKLKIRKKAV